MDHQQLIEIMREQADMIEPIAEESLLVKAIMMALREGAYRIEKQAASILTLKSVTGDGFETAT